MTHTAYRPEVPPKSPGLLPEYLERELRRFSEAFETTRLGFLPQVVEAPSRPSEGMIRYADGVNWDPGDGEGPYMYINGEWLLMTAQTVSQIIEDVAANHRREMIQAIERLEQQLKILNMHMLAITDEKIEKDDVS